MDGLGELIFIQIVYIVVLFFTIRATIRNGKKPVFYFVIVGLYILTLAWLVREFINIPKIGTGGQGFALGMYSMIVPGVLILISLMAFIITQATKKSG